MCIYLFYALHNKEINSDRKVAISNQNIRLPLLLIKYQANANIKITNTKSPIKINHRIIVAADIVAPYE